MLKSLGEFLKNNLKMQLFMSVILLMAVTSIACNMDKVAKKERLTEESKKQNRNGKVVVIDAGHGGKDPGKVGVKGTKEKDINLSISKLLKEELEISGFEVVMTRDEDRNEDISKISDLKKRCDIINDTYEINGECVLISIHQNSFAQKSVHGAQAFYFQRSEKSKKLAEALQKYLNGKINTEKPKNPKPNDSYYMLINSKCPGAIIECGFLSNEREEAMLNDEKHQKEIVSVIKQGIMEYFAMKQAISNT